MRLLPPTAAVARDAWAAAPIPVLLRLQQKPNIALVALVRGISQSGYEVLGSLMQADYVTPIKSRLMFYVTPTPGVDLTSKGPYIT